MIKISTSVVNIKTVLALETIAHLLLLTHILSLWVTKENVYGDITCGKTKELNRFFQNSL